MGAVIATVAARLYRDQATVITMLSRLAMRLSEESAIYWVLERLVQKVKI